MQHRKKVLWIGEAHFLKTGFSIIANEILNRLYNTDKYEIAELGSYAQSDDPNIANCKWKFYSAIPSENDKLLKQRYDSSIYGQFGEATFENCCLDFKPDYVVMLRDNWMDRFVLESAYRKNFKVIWLLTLDGSPQKSPWLEDYTKCDRILTYSHYGKRIIEEESGGKTKSFGVASPGFNHEIFKPLDRDKLRDEFGIDRNANIVTTVMRNQARKLYPDLIQAFSKFISYAANNNNDEIARNTYLHIHTSWPDVGFAIPRLIMESGVSHKILCTYICRSCRKFTVQKFQTEMTFCPYCGNLSAFMPNTMDGLTTEDLVKVYNLANLYIQYSCSEGFGVPIAEAKGCGIPVFAPDHTAMSEQVANEGCRTIKIAKIFHENITQTEQKRFSMCEKDTIEKLYWFFCLSKQEQSKMGELARKDGLENATFERSAKIFENAIDSLEIHDPKDTWFNPKGDFAPLERNLPKFASNSEMIDWAIDHILGKSELKGTIFAGDLLKGLNVGYIGHKNNPNQRVKCDPNYVLNLLGSMGSEHNFWEQQRLNMLKPKEDNSNNIRWALV